MQRHIEISEPFFRPLQPIPRCSRVCRHISYSLVAISPQSDPDVLDAANKTVRVPLLVKADGKGLLDVVTAALAAYDSDIIRAEVRTWVSK